ncbi:MAG: calcium-binding protein, partial [Hyphomicrobiaceae bacterium]
QLNDTIVGGAFDDRFVPGSGSDTINGGGGYDQIGYYNSSINNSGFGVTVTTTATGVGTVALPGGFDTFTSVEQIVGSHNNDTFSGGTGDDDFIPYLGNDTIDGGAGTDWVSYNFDTNRMFRGAVVNLSTGVVDDPYGGTDTILNSSIENVRGTNQMTNGDVLTGLGDGIGNFFRGYAGADTINGLGGNDTVDYQGDIDNGGTAGAYVDLTTGFAQDGMGTYDMLLNIESAIGTNQDRVAGALGDVLIGDGNANVFFARGGLDYIEGRGGNDTIDTGAGMAGTVGDIVVAGAGNDSVIGGSGATFVYGNDGSDYMSGGSGDDWLFGGDFTGTVTGTDTLLGGDGVDVLAVGSAGGNAAMYGGNGNDIMYGGSGVAGNDSMIGGAGSDYMYGGSGGNDGYFFQTADLVAGDFDTIVGFDSGDFLSFSASLNGQIFGQQTTIGGVSGSYLSLGTWALWMPYTTWTSVQAQTFYNS